MNLFKKIVLICFLFLVFPQNVFSNNKIVYLDLDFILSNTNIGKTVLQKLKSNETKKNQEFKTQEQILKDEENKILASTNIINEEQLKINISEFQKKLQNYKRLKSDEITKLKKKRNDEIVNILNLVNPIIEEYMAKNSISIIIDKKNIYIANKSYDITNNLIEIINERIK